MLMLRRGADARFMPGVWVFPGGAVDGEDRDAARDLDLGLESDEARAPGLRGPRARRGGGVDPRRRRASVPGRAGSRPSVVPIRFDTRFYVAFAPPHSKPVPDRGEVDEARWLSPAGALEEHAADRLELSFPTVKHLEELTCFADADAVIAEGAQRHVEAITPKVRGDRDRLRGPAARRSGLRRRVGIEMEETSARRTKRH